MRRYTRLINHLSANTRPPLDLSPRAISRASFLSTTAASSGHLRSQSPNSGVLVEDVGTLGKLVTLNRPKALNALNQEMVNVLTPLYRKWTDDGKDTVDLPLSHSLTLPLSHSLTLSLSHSLTLSLSNSLTLTLSVSRSSRSLTLSLAHSLTLSISHSLTLSLSRSSHTVHALPIASERYHFWYFLNAYTADLAIRNHRIPT